MASTGKMAQRRADATALRELTQTFKHHFYEGMKRYAPVADGWLRSCGMFRVETKIVGDRVMLSLWENEKRPKDALYWKTLEKGSRLPARFRLWANTNGRSPYRRTAVVRQVFSMATDTPGRRQLWYWERPNPSGRWEKARYVRRKVKLTVISSKLDPYEANRTGKSPNAGAGKAKFLNNMYRKMRAKLVGEDVIDGDSKEMWATKRAVVRRPHPFMSAVAFYAIQKTKAEIDAGTVHMGRLKFRYDGTLNNRERLIAMKRAIKLAKEDEDWYKLRWQRARWKKGAGPQEVAGWKADWEARKAIRQRRELEYNQFRDRMGVLRASQRSALAERAARMAKADNDEGAMRQANFASWREKMRADPSAWRSAELREAKRARVEGRQYNAKAVDKMERAEYAAFERRFGFSPMDVGRANAEEAGENMWDRMSKWW